MERTKGVGIINGIDTEIWNPAADPMIAAKFSLAQPAKGKRANKAAFCERFGFSAGLPLISFIGGLVVEKGADCWLPLWRKALMSILANSTFLY